MGRVKRKKLIVLLGVVVLIAGVAFYWWHLRHETDKMSVSWTTTGKPRQVEGVVLDDKGNPVPNLYVNVEDDSGGGGATTDGNGRFTRYLGEQEVRGLRLHGVGELEWDIYGFFGIDCTDGLEFRIILKPGAMKAMPSSAPTTQAK